MELVGLVLWHHFNTHDELVNAMVTYFEGSSANLFALLMEEPDGTPRKKGPEEEYVVPVQFVPEIFFRHGITMLVGGGPRATRYFRTSGRELKCALRDVPGILQEDYDRRNNGIRVPIPIQFMVVP